MEFSEKDFFIQNFLCPDCKDIKNPSYDLDENTYKLECEYCDLVYKFKLEIIGDYKDIIKSKIIEVKNRIEKEKEGNDNYTLQALNNMILNLYKNYNKIKDYYENLYNYKKYYMEILFENIEKYKNILNNIDNFNMDDCEKLERNKKLATKIFNNKNYYLVYFLKK